MANKNKFLKKKNKKGWIRIVEAFISVLLIAGVLLVVIDKGYVGKSDISQKVYKLELSILRSAQLDETLRSQILSATPPVSWDDDLFPLNLKDRIDNRIPSYLICQAKICAIDDICALDNYFQKDIYAQAVVIAANLSEYDPKQLKLFCWGN